MKFLYYVCNKCGDIMDEEDFTYYNPKTGLCRYCEEKVSNQHLTKKCACPQCAKDGEEKVEYQPEFPELLRGMKGE